MNQTENNIREGTHFDTEELKDDVEEGITPEFSMYFFGITREEYDRVLNSKTNIYGKISKTAPAYEGDD